MKENQSGKKVNLLMGGIVDYAVQYKADIVHAPRMWSFDLSELNQIDFTEAGKFRITDGNYIIEYDPEKLLTGIIAGDFVDRKNKIVQIYYYPHEWQGVNVNKKTVITMSLDEAVFLLNRCAQALEIPKELLKSAIEGYSTYTYLGEDALKLHQHDIAPALAKKL